MERFVTDRFRSENPLRWNELRETIKGTTAEGYIACGGATLTFDFMQPLTKLPMPVLVICGADDPLTPASENKRIASLVPHGRYVEVGDARHLCNVEHPDVFNSIMMEWLKDFS